MANRDTNLNINVGVDNRASEELRKVAEQTEALEGEHTVNVGVDDQASDELDDIKQDVDDLDGRRAEVTIAADDNAAREIDRITSDVRDLDGKRAEVTVDVDDNASRKLDQIQSKLRDLDGGKAAIGAGIGGAIGGAIGASDIVDQIFAGGDLAIQTQQVANATGASLENASRLVTVWRQAGFDVADLLDLLGNLNSVIRDNPELADQLGLSTAEDGVTTFLTAVRNLNTEFDSAGERQAAAAQLFGEEGVRQVGEVQVRIGDLDEAVQRVSERTLIDPGDVERAQELNAEMVTFKGHVQDVQLMLLEMVPIVNGLIGGIRSFYEGVYDAGGAVAEAGGDTRRWLEDRLTGAGNAGPVINNDVTRPNRPNGGLLAGLIGQIAGQVAAAANGGGQVVVVNPPATPPAIVDGTRHYQQRNGLQ